jgi:RHS repeat-associated protein
MKMKNTVHWLRPALISAIYLLGSTAGHCFWHPEGRGDAVAVADSPDARAISQCQYGPFGEVIRAAGPMGKDNPFRFSTKSQDDEADLLYYGYRYYNASTGRWLNRDPIDEAGGRNLYAFVRNNGLGSVDYLGRISTSRAVCGCCECAVGISMGTVVKYQRDPVTGYPGSWFDWTVYLDYFPTDKPGSVSYKWWELFSANLPPEVIRAGGKPGKWFDYDQLKYSTGINWRTRDKSCTPPVGRTYVDYDRPFLNPALGKRVLHILIAYINPPCCGPAYPKVVQISAVQTIDPGGKPPVSLDIPDPNPPSPNPLDGSPSTR